MNEALDAGFQFDKRAAELLTTVLRADGIFGVDIFPRIGQLLLEAEAHAFFLAVDVEHHHVQILAHFENLRGMADAALLMSVM